MKRTRLGLAAIVSAAAIVSGSVPAWSQEWQPFPAVEPGQRMALGLRAEQWRPGEAAAKRPPRGDQCRKWRRMADRLGETYAGWTLRNSVLREMCGMLEVERAEEIWDWPWSGLAGGRIIPPRLVRTLGAWELRCGSAGKRRRCALVAALGGQALRGSDGEAQRPVAHFVIDMVGGREALLWRLFVPADRGTAVTELGSSRPDAPASDAALPASRSGAVRYRLGGREHAEQFPACAPTGCLMEANVLRGGAVATRLWDGHTLDLAIELASGRRLELQLPAAGFRAAFAELVRQRREERRGR